MKPAYRVEPSGESARPRRLSALELVFLVPEKVSLTCHVTPLSICRASRTSSSGRTLSERFRRRLEPWRAGRLGVNAKKMAGIRMVLLQLYARSVSRCRWGKHRWGSALDHNSLRPKPPIFRV